MSFKFNLISVAAIVWCFVDQLSAQSVVPSDVVMNENMVLHKNDSLPKVNGFDENELGEQKDLSNAVVASVNENPRQDWIILIDHGANFSNNLGEQKHNEELKKVQGDENIIDDKENIGQTPQIRHKWGKDKGEVIFRKMTWDKERGLTEVQNNGQKKENHQKSQGEKQRMKKYHEQKLKKNGLEHNFILKKWKEHGKQNKNRTENEQGKKSWNEKKLYYHKYKKVLEKHEKKTEEGSNGHQYHASDHAM